MIHLRPFFRRLRPDDCREDVISSDGTITFNYLQQRPDERDDPPPTPVEEAETTDPWGITDAV